jgi:hypothetical protein
MSFQGKAYAAMLLSMSSLRVIQVTAAFPIVSYSLYMVLARLIPRIYRVSALFPPSAVVWLSTLLIIGDNRSQTAREHVRRFEDATIGAAQYSMSRGTLRGRLLTSTTLLKI